jgi:hypothetical protein
MLDCHGNSQADESLPEQAELTNSPVQQDHQRRDEV